MYEITKVLDHYEIRDVDGDITTNVNLTGNSEAEVKRLVEMITMDIGLHKEIYNVAISDAIELLHNME